MSTFINLRLILQEKKPNLAEFLRQLELEDLKKEDLNLLLRKAVESRPLQFADFS